MKKSFFISLFILLAIYSSAFGVSAQTRTNVRVAAEIKVENNLLTLGDIAQISGGNDQKLERLRTISLGYAPNVGMTRELNREKITLSISAAGFSSNEYTLHAPPLVRVQRTGQEISQNQIREAVEKTIFKQITSENVEARIARLDLPEKIIVPTGNVEIRTNLSNVRNIFARFPLSIEIRVNDSVVRRLSANIEIEAFAEVFTAIKDLTIDSKITEADFKVEKRRIEKPLTSYLRDSAKLRGVKIIKNVASAAILTTDSIVAAVVVRSGDAVRIIGQSGKMQITVNGEARANGKIGDRIAVKNSQSNLIVQATVVDEGLVRISF